MSNVIELLEKMGQDAQLRHAPKDAVERMLTLARIDPRLREAVLSEDQQRLESLLGANTNVCCMVRPAEDETFTDEEGEGATRAA